jgi:hypothetical protein
VAVPEFHRTLRFSSMEELKFAHVITLFAGDAVKWSKAASGLVTHVVVEEAPSFSISDVLWPLFCPGSSYCILLLMLTNGIWYCSTQSVEKRREEKRREDEAWKKDEETIGERERVERGGRNQKGKGLGKGVGQEHKGKEEDEKNTPNKYRRTITPQHFHWVDCLIIMGQKCRNITFQGSRFAIRVCIAVRNQFVSQSNTELQTHWTISWCNGRVKHTPHNTSHPGCHNCSLIHSRFNC